MKKLLSRIRARRYRRETIVNARAMHDEALLRNAAMYAAPHLQHLAIGFLGELQIQTAYDCLLTLFKANANTALKTTICIALLDCARSSDIIMDAEDTKLVQAFAERHIEAGKGPVTDRNSPPIIFRDRLKDHLVDLEEMKRRNEFH